MFLKMLGSKRWPFCQSLNRYIRVKWLWTSVSITSHPNLYSLQWRHNEWDGVSKQRHLHCLLNRFFRRGSKKTSSGAVQRKHQSSAAPAFVRGIHRWLLNSTQKRLVVAQANHVASVNTFRPRQNERHFPDDILKCIFLNKTLWISFKFSLAFVHNGLINNIPALVQIMAWRRPGGKPLSEPMMVSLLEAYMSHFASTI